MADTAHNTRIPTSQPIGRRAFLASAPLVAFSTSALAFKGPEPKVPDTDPIEEWLKQWKLITQRLDNWPADDEDSPIKVAISDDRREIGRHIIASRPSTREGIIAQIEFSIEDHLVGEAYEDGSDRQMFQAMLGALKNAS